MFKPERKKVIAVSFLFLCFSYSLLAQAVPDSIQIREMVETLVKDEVEEQLKGLKLLTGLTASGLVLYAALTWFWGIKKKADEVVKTRVEALVEEEVKNITGSRIDTIQHYFKAYQQSRDKLAKQPLYVLFHPETEQPPLIDYLRAGGFTLAEGMKMGDQPPAFSTSSIVLLNKYTPAGQDPVSDGTFDDYVKPFANRVKLVFYGNGKYEGAHKMANYANSKSTLLDALKKVVG